MQKPVMSAHFQRIIRGTVIDDHIIKPRCILCNIIDGLFQISFLIIGRDDNKFFHFISSIISFVIYFLLITQGTESLLTPALYYTNADIIAPARIMVTPNTPASIHGFTLSGCGITANRILDITIIRGNNTGIRYLPLQP